MGSARAAAAVEAAVMQAGVVGQGAAAVGVPARAQDAEWLPLNQPAPMAGLEWRGSTEIRQDSQRNWSKKMRDQHVINMTTPRHWFSRFFDEDIIFLILQQTNLYVTTIRVCPRPPGYHKAWAWLLTWAASWEPLTCRTLLEWIALAIYMACHKNRDQQ